MVKKCVGGVEHGDRYWYSMIHGINSHYDVQPELKSDKNRLYDTIKSFVQSFSNSKKDIIDEIKFDLDIKDELTKKLDDNELITAIMNKVYEPHHIPTRVVTDNKPIINILNTSEQQNIDLAKNNNYARKYVNEVKAIFENPENTNPYLKSMDIIINENKIQFIEQRFDEYDNKLDNDINKITSIDNFFDKNIIPDNRDIHLFFVLLYLLNRKIVNLEKNNPENLDLEYYKTLLETLKENFFAIGTNKDNMSPDIIPSKEILLGYLKDILKKKIKANTVPGGAGKKRRTKRSKAPTAKRTRGKKAGKKSKRTAKKMRS